MQQGKLKLAMVFNHQALRNIFEMPAFRTLPQPLRLALSQGGTEVDIFQAPVVSHILVMHGIF